MAYEPKPKIDHMPFLVDQWQCRVCLMTGELYPPRDLNARRGEEGIEEVLRDHRKRQPKGEWCNGFIQAVSSRTATRTASSAQDLSGTF